MLLHSWNFTAFIICKQNRCCYITLLLKHTPHLVQPAISGYGWCSILKCKLWYHNAKGLIMHGIVGQNADSYNPPLPWPEINDMHTHMVWIQHCYKNLCIIIHYLGFHREISRRLLITVPPCKTAPLSTTSIPYTLDNKASKYLKS